MGYRKNKNGRKSHIKAIRNPDDRTTYLGHPVTYWELKNLDIKHQIHAMIFHEHGLVDRHRGTKHHTALPLLDGRPIPEGPARDEACEALILMTPTGLHFESEDGLNDPYVWSRRGAEGDLGIIRLSKVRRGDLVGFDAFSTSDEVEADEEEVTGKPVGGRKRRASVADLDSDDETVYVTSENDSDATVVCVDAEEHGVISSFEVLNPPPAKKLRGWKVIPLPSKCKSARLKRADLTPRGAEAFNRKYIALKVTKIEQPPSRMRRTKRTESTKSAVGVFQKPFSATENAQLRPGRLTRKLKHTMSDKHAVASGLLFPAAKGLSQPHVTSKEHQTDKTKPKKPPRPVQIGRPDFIRETQPLVGLPPMPMGKTVWKYQAWFDSVADPDTIAAISARSKRARQEAFESISPLSSPGTEPATTAGNVQIEGLGLDTLRQKSAVKRTIVRMSKGSQGLSIAEQKKPAGLLLLDAHKKARMKPKALTQENAQERAVISDNQSEASIPSVPEKELSVPSSISSPPAFVVSPEKRRVNPLLDQLAMCSLAEVEALRKGSITGGSSVVSQQRREEAHIAPSVVKAKQKKASSGFKRSTKFEAPSTKLGTGPYEIEMPKGSFSLIWLTPDTQTSIRKMYYS